MASARAALFDNCTCRIGKHLSTAGIGAGGQRRLSGVFHEVVEPERLVVTTAVVDVEGNSLFEVLQPQVFALGA